ncbi:nitronate monooxygenase [Pseudenhygromyxa sp. WMMC2535]|uniref:NAD(P)H-dependent flavin oxidoreductase n=1 Tax=Pseudenhygromyxa sp. WMMC2535 TaxID=2712867 RepID=UPI0015528A63|nr:nitronate monooxygenase [Pseudenhygromyxa sp. WMMC2535]NVB36495.1 nitronate monooxygenase [Pseudenhygromyxa sp. WMMC2535]
MATRSEPTAFTRDTGASVPLICGAMYPCSNPELVAAVSAAGGLGVVQPLSMIYVHGRDLRAGLREIKAMTQNPIGFNALVEQSSKVYEDRMRRWVDVALEEGVRFFVTALGNPRWVVERVHALGGVVYHDVTERKWAEKALASGVDGLICVNGRAGGHAGTQDPRRLYEALADLDVPLVCAGGVGDEAAFVEALGMGYAAVQMGTRFIATQECQVHADYKRAIVEARAEDIVLTDRISGVPVAVIETESVRAQGTRAGPVARRLLRHPRAKHWVRALYSLRSLWQLGRASQRGVNYRDYFQAGRSVEGIRSVESAKEVVDRFAMALSATQSTGSVPEVG